MAFKIAFREPLAKIGNSARNRGTLFFTPGAEASDHSAGFVRFARERTYQRVFTAQGSEAVPLDGRGWGDELTGQPQIDGPRLRAAFEHRPELKPLVDGLKSWSEEGRAHPHLVELFLGVLPRLRLYNEGEAVEPKIHGLSAFLDRVVEDYTSRCEEVLSDYWQEFFGVLVPLQIFHRIDVARLEGPVTFDRLDPAYREALLQTHSDLRRCFSLRFAEHLADREGDLTARKREFEDDLETLITPHSAGDRKLFRRLWHRPMAHPDRYRGCGPKGFEEIFSNLDRIVEVFLTTDLGKLIIHPKKLDPRSPAYDIVQRLEHNMRAAGNPLETASDESRSTLIPGPKGSALLDLVAEAANNPAEIQKAAQAHEIDLDAWIKRFSKSGLKELLSQLEGQLGVWQKRFARISPAAVGEYYETLEELFFIPPVQLVSDHKLYAAERVLMFLYQTGSPFAELEQTFLGIYQKVSGKVPGSVGGEREIDEDPQRSWSVTSFLEAVSLAVAERGFPSDLAADMGDFVTDLARRNPQFAERFVGEMGGFSMQEAAGNFDLLDDLARLQEERHDHGLPEGFSVLAQMRSLRNQLSLNAFKREVTTGKIHLRTDLLLETVAKMLRTDREVHVEYRKDGLGGQKLKEIPALFPNPTIVYPHPDHLETKGSDTDPEGFRMAAYFHSHQAAGPRASLADIDKIFMQLYPLAVIYSPGTESGRITCFRVDAQGFYQPANFTVENESGATVSEDGIGWLEGQARIMEKNWLREQGLQRSRFRFPW